MPDTDSAAPGEPPPVRGRWVLFTSLGWLLGFVLVVVAAVSMETIGLAGNQSVIGIGMGLGVGIAQRGLARRRLGVAKHWVTASLVGLALPFVAADVLAGVGAASYSLAPCVVVGGILVGLLQWRLLRAAGHDARWWTVASTAGWSVAVVPILLGDALVGRGAGPIGGIVSLVTLAGGGAWLGLVTGVAIPRMLRTA